MSYERVISREAIVRRIKALRRLSEHPNTEPPLAEAAKAKAIELYQQYAIPLALLVEDRPEQRSGVPPPPPPSGITFVKTADGYAFSFTYDYDPSAYHTFMAGMAEIRARLRAEHAAAQQRRLEG